MTNQSGILTTGARMLYPSERLLIVSAMLGAMLIAACAKQESPKVDSSKTAVASPAGPAASPASPAKLGETGGMKTPESVRYDPELDVYYVSNINGNPSQHDGNGFIDRVRADSTGVLTMLAEGGKNGVT